MPWFLRRGLSWYDSRICAMRSTASDWRQIAVSVASRPAAGGLRHASHSARRSVYSASARAPCRRTSTTPACAAVALPLVVEQQRDAPPLALAGGNRAEVLRERVLAIGAAAARRAASGRCPRRRSGRHRRRAARDVGAADRRVDHRAAAGTGLGRRPCRPTRSSRRSRRARRGSGPSPSLKLWIEYAVTGCARAARVGDLEQHHHRVALVAERRHEERLGRDPADRDRRADHVGLGDVADLARARGHRATPAVPPTLTPKYVSNARLRRTMPSPSGF